MKTLKTIVLLSIVGLSVSAQGRQVRRGGESSGGGLALVCRDQGKIRHAELLDLFEARTKFGFQLMRASGSVERDYFLSVDNTYRLQGNPMLARQRQKAIEENLRRFFDLVRLTAPGEKLPPTNDVGEIPALPQGCGLEQLAVFQDRPEALHLDREIWSALDSLSQAALVSHELAYREERQTHLEMTSESARSFVAVIYAVTGPVPVHQGLSRGARACSTSDLNPAAWIVTSRSGSITSSMSKVGTSFYVEPAMTPQGPGVRLQFTQLAGRPIVTKGTIEIPRIGFNVKAAFDRSTNKILMLADEAASFQGEIAVRGTQYAGLSVIVSYQPGLPVRLIFKKQGRILSEQVLTFCK